MRRILYLLFFPAFHYVSARGYLLLREFKRSGRAPQGQGGASADAGSHVSGSASSLVLRPLAHSRAQVHAMLAQWVAALGGREFLGGKEPNLLDLVCHLGHSLHSATNPSAQSHLLLLSFHYMQYNFTYGVLRIYCSGYSVITVVLYIENNIVYIVRLMFYFIDSCNVRRS